MFAVWDAKHTQVKSSCATKVSSKTMFSMNKVREQVLAGKTQEEKADIIHTATTDRVKDLRKNTHCTTRSIRS